MAAGHRYIQLAVTAVGGGATLGISELKAYWGGSWQFLTSATVTQTVGGTNGSYPLSRINDGTAETTNATNLWNANSATATIVIDLGSAQDVTGLGIAPQGVANSNAYDTPTNFTISVGDSGTSGPWTTVYTGSSVTSGYPAWNPGTYRAFTW